MKLQARVKGYFLDGSLAHGWHEVPEKQREKWWDLAPGTHSFGNGWGKQLEIEIREVTE